MEKLLVAHDTSEDVIALTTPASTVAVRRGKGMVVVDRLRWDTETANVRKAARHACSLLGLLGGDLVSRSGVNLECEDMTPQKDLSLFSNRGGILCLACNGSVSRSVRVAAAGKYTKEVFAGGTPAQGEYPIVEVSLDGKKIARIQTSGVDCRPYPVTAELTPGEHELTLAFVNDFCAGVEDRNLCLDKVVFYRDTRYTGSPEVP